MLINNKLTQEIIIIINYILRFSTDDIRLKYGSSYIATNVETPMSSNWSQIQFSVSDKNFKIQIKIGMGSPNLKCLRVLANLGERRQTNS